MEQVFFGQDYQFGHCHYFAEYLKKVFEKVLPNEEIKYHLILAERMDSHGDNIDDVLVHAYLKVGGYLIDSEGVYDISIASEREKGWADKEKDLTPDGYNFETWEEESDEIPEFYFNRFCSKNKLKQDVIDFMRRDDVQELIDNLR